ncbi:MAG: hypothetical protein JKY92_05465 [Magnetovibrio sp.]|nr:hypothetical protein [Magnetovibrio sp.]
MSKLTAKLEMFYRPVINPANDHVVIYRAIPVMTQDGDVKTGAKQVLEYSGDPIDTAQKNIAVLRKAAVDLQIAHDNGKSVFLILPISANA